MATETRLGHTGASVHAARPRPPIPFSRTLSAALDDLELQFQMNPGRWKKRLIQLRKLILERRAMGRAA